MSCNIHKCKRTIHHLTPVTLLYLSYDNTTGVIIVNYFMFSKIT